MPLAARRDLPEPQRLVDGGLDLLSLCGGGQLPTLLRVMAQRGERLGIECPRQDSNLRPSAPEADALSPELRGRNEKMLRRWAPTA
jgi:hypothetical protein